MPAVNAPLQLLIPVLLKRFLFLLFALSFIGFLVFGIKPRKGSRISPQARYWLAMVAFIALLCFVLWRL